MNWINCTFSALSNVQVYEILKLRSAVFVVEQDCVYQDVDDLDLHPETQHLAAYDEGIIVAYLRILGAGVSYDDVSIGRVITADVARGKGIGHELLKRGLQVAEVNWPNQDYYLSAQAHLQSYYARQGFTAVTNEYLEDGIPHIGMRRVARC